MVDERAVNTRVHQAIDGGIREYFQGARERVPGFVKKHYQYPGCWQTNRVAFGFDLIRNPINLLWAPVYLVVQLLAMLFTRFSWPCEKPLSLFASWLPVGFVTNVQTRLNEDIASELLSKDDIQASVTKHLIEELSEQHPMDSSELNETLSKLVKEALNELMNARTAAGDITNTLMMTLVGLSVFKKFTPGGVGVGMLLAAIWVEHQAANNFFLGSTLGGVFYGVFPPEPSFSETLLSILLVMIFLSVLASFSGLLIDPILARLGFHRRRLLRLVNHVEGAILQSHQKRFKTLDPYLARILEFFDSVKSALPM